MRILLVLACCIALQALECDVQFENDQICVSKVLIAPEEVVELHCDVLPHIVIALQGGTITRLESDGREVDVEFPTGRAIYRPVNLEMHRTVNKSETPVEIIIIQMKSDL